MSDSYGTIFGSEPQETVDSSPTIGLTDNQMAFIKAAAASQRYQERMVPDELSSEFLPKLTDFAFITPISRSNLSSFYPSASHMLGCLQEDWACALESHAFYMYDSSKVNFATRRRLSDGTVAEISIARNNREYDGKASWKPWVVVRVPYPNQLAKDDAAFEGVAPVEAEATLEPIPDQLTQEMLSMRSKKDYLQGRISAGVLSELRSFSGPLSSFAYLPKDKRDRITKIAGFNFDVASLLDRDFATDLDNEAIREFEGKVLFPISIARADGETPVEITIRRQKNHGKNESEAMPWRVTYVDDFVRETAQARFALDRWATIPSWEGMLSSLADIALPEMWDFEDSDVDDESRFSILRSYLKYTFYHLQVEGKICEDPELDFAAFNTGLVNKVYDPLYACFSKKDGADRPWVFSGFCRAGSRSLGKSLVRSFNPLPERAEYFTRKEDLLYDTDQPLELDTDHILLDNISRLPLDFLEDELDGDPDAREIISDLRECMDNEQRNILFGDLKEIVGDSPRLLRRLMNRLDDAKDLALKRVEWNFRTAVPAFYPRRNTMSLLLPLDLTDNEQPDIALVVEPTESGAYLGQTILTMRMAYNNARLVCRPDSDWLNTSVSLLPGEDPEGNDEED